jgi:HSP20 family protein
MSKHNLTLWNRTKNYDFVDSFLNSLREMTHPFVSPDNELFYRPLTDVSEDKDNFYIRVELAGMQKENITLEYSDVNALLLTAKKTEEKDDKSKNYHLRESSSRVYQREIFLPRPIEKNAITAKFEGGILNITIKKLQTEGHGNIIEIK